MMTGDTSLTSKALASRNPWLCNRRSCIGAVDWGLRMLTVLTCLTTAHDYRFVGAALAICTFGYILSMRLFSTARNARRARRGAFV